MPTNEERKAVAARLRDFESLRPVFKDSNICGFLEALGVGYMDWKGICDRLADLIEPEERTCELESPKSGKRRCKRCGAFVSVDTVWDCCGVIPVRFCPNCGARVKEDE